MSTPSTNGELADSASSSGRKLRSALQTAIARSAPLIADVDVEAEGVVAPDDVAQELVVAPVVRRVDDPLLLPRAPRVRAGGAERDARAASASSKSCARRSPIGAPPPRRSRSGPCGPRPRRRSARRRGAPRARVPCAAACSSSKRLASVERLGVEERELLLDREREVACPPRTARGRTGAARPGLRRCASPKVALH